MVATAREAKSAELTWIRLMRVYQQIDRRTAALMRTHGLSVSRFDVLNHAGAKEGRTQQELADALFVTKGNVCQVLDGMERDGLLYRQRRGRENRIFLTETGTALREQSLADQRRLIADALGSLSTDEQHQLQSLLRTIDLHLGHQEG
ncbi:MAG: MarR family transcriptional regulator [Thermomicrobiales bacterium]|nr:MarR family transcriptional regulator [Thermomicrobiales bacterium]